ncbi:MAG: thermonuclease family protein [Magnetospiraceae bacterium]
MRVYDGDTFTADATPWPKVTIRVSVRLRGVDTPELRGKCEAEKAKARAARDALKELLQSAPVTITNIERGKYAGRVVADVWAGDVNAAEVLIAEGLGRPYDGGKRVGWCE